MADFTDEEKERIREILKYQGEFEEMMAFRSARKLVFKTYRSVVIGTAGLIVAVVGLWDQIKAILRGMIQ